MAERKGVSGLEEISSQELAWRRYASPDSSLDCGLRKDWLVPYYNQQLRHVFEAIQGRKFTYNLGIKSFQEYPHPSLELSDDTKEWVNTAVPRTYESLCQEGVFVPFNIPLVPWSLGIATRLQMSDAFDSQNQYSKHYDPAKTNAWDTYLNRTRGLYAVQKTIRTVDDLVYPTYLNRWKWTLDFGAGGHMADYLLMRFPAKTGLEICHDLSLLTAENNQQIVVPQKTQSEFAIPAGLH